MTTTVTLGGLQSAEPNKCGSCNNYEPRNDYDGMGICTWTFPPWVKTRGREKEDFEVDPRTVQDTTTCSFYTPKVDDKGHHVMFRKEVYWEAGTDYRKKET